MTSIVFSFVLILYGISSSLSSNVRLVGGKNPNEGRVEVFYQNQWGTVCNDLWNDLIASIVCKQLNKGFGKVLPEGTYPPGTGKIWMDDVVCVGIESSLFECLSRPYGQNDCKHSEDVSIRCFNNTSPTTTTPTNSIQPSKANCQSNSNEIRLKGKTKGIGTVEIYNQGTWGTICDDFWDLNDAKVVCRRLCYNDTYAFPGANRQYIEDNGTPVLVNRLDCKGTEGDIKQCPKFSWAPGTCKLLEAATVTCIYQDNSAKKAPSAKLMCTDTHITTLFSRVADPNLKPKHLKVGLKHNGTCNPVLDQNITFVSITVPVSECGITIELNKTHIIYRLLLWYLPTDIVKDIVKQNTYRHMLSCSFPRKGQVGHGPLLVQTETVTQRSTGTFVFTMEFYHQSSFRNRVTKFPFELPLGSWLNVAVFVKTDDDKRKLIVPSCWVTASADRISNPKHILFLNKCPVDQTSSLAPLNQSALGFRFVTFTFLSNNNSLYVHCDTFVCLQDEKTEECDQSCGFKNRRRKRRDTSQFVHSTVYQVTSKPFLVETGSTQSTHLSTVQENKLIYTTSISKMLKRTTITHTTENRWRSLNDKKEVELRAADWGKTVSDSSTNTVEEQSGVPGSTVNDERDIEISTPIDNQTFPKSKTLTEETTQSNFRMPKQEGPEFAKLVRNDILGTASKSSGLKSFQYFQGWCLAFAFLWYST